jgi:hypothetical protein
MPQTLSEGVRQAQLERYKTLEAALVALRAFACGLILH